jgi:hypothetical protein
MPPCELADEALNRLPLRLIHVQVVDSRVLIGDCAQRFFTSSGDDDTIAGFV